MTNTSLFHRYWWNTRILSFTKNHIFIARRYCLNPFTCEDIGVAMVTSMISQLQESFPLRRAACSFEISFTKWLRGAIKLPVTFSMSCQILTSILFPSLENIQEDLPKSWKVMLKNSLKTNKKKCCLLCRYFISISKINRSLHGRLGIQISFSRAESISHSKMKFVSPRSHAISSIFAVIDINRCFVRWDREIHIFNPCFRACPQNWTPLFH